MPTYEYECQACKHQFEQLQSMKAEPIKVCPKCQGSVKRLLGTGSGIIFKGSGFYQTDYRSSSYQKKAEADKKPGSPANPPAKPDKSSKSSDPKPKT